MPCPYAKEGEMALEMKLQAEFALARTTNFDSLLLRR